MTTYAFRAVRANGGAETGFVEADNREAAVALIARRGSFVVSLSDDANGGRPRRPPVSELALGLRSLATLLSSGLPISRALTVFGDLAPPSWSGALADLRARVEKGEQFGTSLARSSLELPAHIIGIIRAGEASGSLAAAVTSAAALLEARAANHAAIRNALAYPMMLAIAGSASAGLLVGVVLPRFAALIADANQQLPMSTRLVLDLGSAARVSAIPFVCLGAIGLAWWKRRLAHANHRTNWHQRLQKMQGVGPIRRARATAGACSALAALLEAGVPIRLALHHAGLAAGDDATAAALVRVRERISKGNPISEAMAAESALTPAAIRLIRVGEETGRLPEMLAHAGQLEADQGMHALQRLIRVLEPTLILAFGGLVAVVAAALLQAMYSLRPSV